MSLHIFHVHGGAVPLGDNRIEELPHVRVIVAELVDFVPDALDCILEVGVVVSAEGVVGGEGLVELAEDAPVVQNVAEVFSSWRRLTRATACRSRCSRRLRFT